MSRADNLGGGADCDEHGALALCPCPFRLPSLTRDIMQAMDLTRNPDRELLLSGRLILTPFSSQRRRNMNSHAMLFNDMVLLATKARDNQLTIEIEVRVRDVRWVDARECADTCV